MSTPSSETRILIGTIIDEPIEDHIYAIIEPLSGEITRGLLLEVESTGEKWLIESLAYVSAAIIEQGLDGLLLKRIDHQAPLLEGMKLVSRSQ
jgi:hypothetical protein